MAWVFRLDSKTMWNLATIFMMLYWFLNPNWHETGHFYPLVILGLYFVSWICIKNSQTFLDVKIDIIRVNLTSCQAHWVLWNLLPGGAKDEHFSCFLNSCQLGIRSRLRENEFFNNIWRYNSLTVNHIVPKIQRKDDPLWLAMT